MSRKKQTFEQWLNKESDLKVSFFNQLDQNKKNFYGLTITNSYPQAHPLKIYGTLKGNIYVIHPNTFDKLCKEFNSYKYQQKNQGSIRFQIQISKQTFKKFEKIKNDLQIKTTANTLEFIINNLQEKSYPKAIDQTQQLWEQNRKLRETIQTLRSAISTKEQSTAAKEQLQQQKSKEIIDVLYNKLHQATLNLDLLSERLDCTIDEYLETIDQGNKEKHSKEVQTRLKSLLNLKIKEIDTKYSLETMNKEQFHAQLATVDTNPSIPLMPKRPSYPTTNQPIMTPTQQNNQQHEESKTNNSNINKHTMKMMRGD